MKFSFPLKANDLEDILAHAIPAPEDCGQSEFSPEQEKEAIRTLDKFISRKGNIWLEIDTLAGTAKVKHQGLNK